jgi:integrase
MPKLTVKEIETIQQKLRAGEAVPSMIPDGNSLYLRTRKTGGMSFVVRRWGFPLLTLGPVDMGLATARKEAAKALALQAQGIDPSEAKREAKKAKLEESLRTDLTFDEVLQMFVDRHCKPNLRTWRRVESILRKDASPEIGQMPIADITKRNLGEVLDKVVDRGTIRTAGILQSHLHGMFRWAVGRGYLERNPASEMPLVGVSTKRDRVLSDEELRLVWQASGTLWEPYTTIFRLLMLTGQRKSEIANGYWAELDLDDKRLWKLPAKRVKNKQPHTFPLSPAAVQILKDAHKMENSEFIFTLSGSGPVANWDYVKKKLDERVKELNGGKPITEWRIHDLRRSVATGMASINIAPHVIEATLNHLSGSKAGVAGIYNRHSYLDEMRIALDAWAVRLGKIIAGTAKGQN